MSGKMLDKFRYSQRLVEYCMNAGIFPPGSTEDELYIQA